jgi:membrane protein required for colicin V production
MSIAFQVLDVVVVAIVIVSAIYGIYRGFVSESLSVFAWIAAAFATLYFGPWTAYWMRGMIAPAWLGEIVGYAVVFLVVVIPLSFASFRISENVKKSQVGTLDGAFGLAFGIARGLVLIGIAYLVFTAAVPTEEQPGWVTRARLLPVVRASAEAVASVIPDQHVDGSRQAATEPADKPVAPEKKVKKEPPPSTQKPAKKTYGAKDRQALDRLIEATGSDTSGKP